MDQHVLRNCQLLSLDGAKYKEKTFEKLGLFTAIFFYVLGIQTPKDLAE